MLDVLTNFIEQLRAAGIPVSMVEAIDAAEALRCVDLGERMQLKHTLGATLVKNVRHWEAFETVFEVYFGLRPPEEGGPEDAERVMADSSAISGDGTGPGGGELELDALIEALFRAVRDEDRGLLLAVVRQAVLQLSGLEPGRPVGGTYYLYRIMRLLDIDALRRRLLRADAEGGGLTPLEQRMLTEEIDRRIAGFREALRAEIRRRLVADRGPEAVSRTLRRPLVEDIDLMTATRDELAEIERVVHPLARKLAVRLARRRRQGRVGRLDVRRTVRASLSTGGVPVDPRFRRPRHGKPELVLLCDISGSVATFARFTMQNVSAIASQFSRVRSFAFIDGIDEVTDYFGPGVDFGSAMSRISSEARVVWLDGHSDYGNVFGRFADEYLESLSPRSTVIITGDARTNYHDPDAPALRRIAESARAVLWLNPEQRRYWDTGDSVIGTYAELCDAVYEVRNLRQLEQFVELVVLPTTRPFRRVV